MKILNTLWFTEMGSPRPIGIVFGVDEVTGKHKAYIGTCSGMNEKLDADYIAQHGAKFPFESAKLLWDSKLK